MKVVEVVVDIERCTGEHKSKILHNFRLTLVRLGAKSFSRRRRIFFQDIQNILLKKPQAGSNQHDSFMLVHALLCIELEKSDYGVVGCFKF